MSAIYAGTVHPGKYLVMVTGDTASVEIAQQVGLHTARGNVRDSVFLADIHPDVVRAIVAGPEAIELAHEALGVVESTSVAAAIDAADAGVKAANVELSSVQLADGLGGKGYVLFSGEVAEVEAAVAAAEDRTQPHSALVRADVIAQLHQEMAENLSGHLRFLQRLGSG